MPPKSGNSNKIKTKEIIKMANEENKDKVYVDVDKEEKATDFIPKKEKPKLKMSRYTVMLVPDSTDDAKTYEFTIDKIARCAVIALAVIIIIVSLIVSFAVKNYRLRNDSSLQSVIDNMEVDADTLQKKNDELTEIVKMNEASINELREQVSELELATAGLYIPSIKPYKGSALLISDLIVDNAISYSCLEGAAIVATANGTVEKITENMHGYEIILDHKNGYKTSYTVEEPMKVSEGDDVVRGEVLLYVSEDDETFSYAVVLDGKNQNPKDFFDMNQQ